MSVKAAIDIGTNSVRLLLARCQDGTVIPLRKELRTTRLGEGVHHSGHLSSAAIARTAEAVQDLASLARQYGAGEISAVATSAVRDAANGIEFVELCQQMAGIKVEILPGPVEARLSFAGAVLNQPAQGSALVIDIGGGSTELAWGQNKELIYANSLNLGAVRLKELFPPVHGGHLGNPVVVYDYIRSQLEQLAPVSEGTQFIAVGGTATSLAAIDQQLTVYDRDKVHGYFLSAQRVDSLLATLAALTLDKRKEIAGLQPERADIIVYGAAILSCLLGWYRADGIRVSEHDILEGIIGTAWHL